MKTGFIFEQVNHLPWQSPGAGSQFFLDPVLGFWNVNIWYDQRIGVGSIMQGLDALPRTQGRDSFTYQMAQIGHLGLNFIRWSLHQHMDVLSLQRQMTTALAISTLDLFDETRLGGPLDATTKVMIAYADLSRLA